MELLTAIVVIAILAAMIIPAFGYMRERAERTKCVANLKSLYVGATLYIQDHGSWPHVSAATVNTPAFADAWIRAFERYAIQPDNWVCPSVQRLMHNPDLLKPENRRIDYFATPFGPERMAPYRYPRQPWFLERADVHGEGQMIIFANGDVKSLREVLRDRTVQRVD